MEWWIIDKNSIDKAFVAISFKSNEEDTYLIVNILKKC